MIEYFDVVDKDDVITGELTTKEEAHKNGILHRVAAIYVFAKDGRLYVQEHKASGLLDHSVGGHVSAGEDYPTAAKREGTEELGLVDELITEVITGLYSDERYDKNLQKSFQVHQFGVFECHPKDTWKFTPNEEVENIILMELSELVAVMNDKPGKFTPGFLNTMAEYIKVQKLPFKMEMTDIRRKWGITFERYS